jgi:nitrogen fixation protein NifQ
MSPTFPLWPAAELSPMRSGYELLTKAVTGVLRHAGVDVLPPFARTLGLPQRELMDLLECCRPHEAYVPVAESKYAVLLRTVPPLFSEVAALLMALRTPEADAQHVNWLARAIAAASLGNRMLWQDLGLAGRHELVALIKLYFQPLYQRNSTGLKWKRLIFRELGVTQGRQDMRPPGCHRCAQYRQCFASGHPAPSTWAA